MPVTAESVSAYSNIRVKLTLNEFTKKRTTLYCLEAQCVNISMKSVQKINVVYGTLICCTKGIFFSLNVELLEI